MSQDADQAEQAIAKTLRLRGAPLPVARVSRRALVIVGAVLIAGVAGALGWSLMEKRKAAPAEPRLTTAPPPEMVTALPRGYVGAAGVPALGPPLPGDLGRPMLSAARARENGVDPAGTASGVTEPAGASAVPQPQAIVDPVIQAQREARRAAFQSGLFVAAVARDVGEAAQAAVIAQPAGQGGRQGAGRRSSTDERRAPAVAGLALCASGRRGDPRRARDGPALRRAGTGDRPSHPGCLR